MVLNFPAEMTYTCHWDPKTEHHKNGVYRILGVPGSPGDEIHVGNFCGDTSKGWDSDVTGCLVLGFAVGFLRNKSFNSQRAIVTSGPAIDALIAFTGKQDFQLEVKGLPSTAG